MKRASFVAAVAGALAVAFLLGHGMAPVQVEAQQQQQMRVAAVPTEKGGQDMFGAYEPVEGWPKPLSSVSFSSTIRTDGLPSGVDVASAIDSGTSTPASRASSNQRRNCRCGSGSRSRSSIA